MIWIYRICFPLLFLLGSPFYLLRMRKRKAYGPMLGGRFGRYRLPPRSVGKRRIWLQAVSVGELLAIEGLIQRLAARPDVELILSTTTSTGYQLANKKYRSQVAAVISFPLDFFPVIRRAWDRIQPDLCVMTEAELWPEHLHTAHRRKVPLLLINARLSDKSYRRMKRFIGLQPLFYQEIKHIAAASELDAKRILDLGFPAERMTVTGNLKFDVAESIVLSPEAKEKLARSLWHEPTRTPAPFTIIGASTWSGEEKLLLDSACALQRDHDIPVRLLLTPRHAERRGELHSLLRGYGDSIQWQFRTRPDWRSESSHPGVPEVMVADTTGELKYLLQVADVAVIGRSFPPHTEGQTPIEAAALGVPVVYGPSLSNFRSICRALEAAGGVKRVDDPASLVEVLAALSCHQTQREALSRAAREVFEHNRGSTERTFALIVSHF